MNRKLLLIDERGKKHLVDRGIAYQTEGGMWKISSTAKAGDVIQSHLGHKAVLMEPNVRDYVEKMTRATRILHFEDIGYVLAFAGLREGQMVVEAGTGCGACALYFSQAVGKSGRVVSFERREDAYRVASENILGFGCDNIQLVNADLKEKPKDLLADLFFLDLASPSEYLELAFRSLNPGGLISAYAPFVEEGTRCIRKLKSLGCIETCMTEISRRDYETLDSGTRPRTTQTVHTGYLVFGRRVPLGES